MELGSLDRGTNEDIRDTMSVHQIITKRIE